MLILHVAFPVSVAWSGPLSGMNQTVGIGADLCSALALVYYYPTDLLLSPKDWHAMIPVGFVWVTLLTLLKAGWCLGIGRSTAKQLMGKQA